MTSIRDDSATDDGLALTLTQAAVDHPEPDPRRDSIDRHPSTLGRRLTTYLDAVACELRARGVLTGTPQHTDLGHRLIGSIVLDCTTLRIAAWTRSEQQHLGRRSLGAAIHPGRPTPVIATWDEHDGWCVGLHHDPSNASRRYLHPDLLPTAHTVADFVVGLALGHHSGADHPLTADGASRFRLRRRL
ncbi:MAG: hypothetical protein H7Y15_01470 [Pseudonocardia sp.]|nr:hypothetical protein [Pseudonocardia sp.]